MHTNEDFYEEVRFMYCITGNYHMVQISHISYAQFAYENKNYENLNFIARVTFAWTIDASSEVSAVRTATSPWF